MDEHDGRPTIAAINNMVDEVERKAFEAVPAPTMDEVIEHMQTDRAVTSGAQVGQTQQQETPQRSRPGSPVQQQKNLDQRLLDLAD